jgi:hypothetical protein
MYLYDNSTYIYDNSIFKNDKSGIGHDNLIINFDFPIYSKIFSPRIIYYRAQPEPGRE